MQGDPGQTLVSDEQVGAPAQVKDRPALSLGGREDGRSLLRSAGGQQPLGRAADAPGGAGGQGVLAGGLGEEFGQGWGGRYVWFSVFGFQLYVSSSKLELDNKRFEIKLQRRERQRKYLFSLYFKRGSID